ncbi:hypothetical protein KBC55_02430 [Patescibacteria group bacterium]|jgi:cell division protein FtsB|nr:hypothetical protein [Patescibacteria group bacterium]
MIAYKEEKYTKMIALGQIMLGVFTIVLGISYVAQVNTASTSGFVLRDLESRSRELRMENDKLSAEIVRLRSLASINERQSFLGLVKITDVVYIDTHAGLEIAVRD